MIRLSTMGELLEADLFAAHLLGFMSIEQLFADTDAFLCHSRFSLSGDLIELITRVKETGLVLETTIAVTNALDGEIRSLNVQFKAICGINDVSNSWLATLTDSSTTTQEDAITQVTDPNSLDENSVEAFFASLSHEIRTPLNSLNGVLQLFENTSLNPQQEKYLQIAQASGHKLLEVTDDLFDLTKIDAGHYKLKTSTFSLQEVINDSLQELAPRAINKQLVFSSRISSSVPHAVMAESSAISYIVKALAENAIKFTTAGSVTTTVTCDRIESGAAHIKITLQDTGSGISEAQMLDLHDLFNSPDFIAIPKNGCARLGLTLCQRVLSLTKGTFGIDSTEGKGTVVTVTIPMQVAQGGETAAQRLETSLTGRKVMVIDECPVSLEYISGVLTPRGIQVDHFNRADAAHHALSTAAQAGAPYDLVLLDFTLPDMNGHEFAGKVVDQKLSPGTRLVLLSTNDQILSSAEMKLRGFSASMTKPIRSSELIGTLGNVFSNRPAAATQIAETVYVADNGTSHSAKPPVDQPNRQLTTNYRKVPERALLQDQALARDESIAREVGDVADQDAPLILIVEDNPVNLLVAEETLLDAGYRVDIANHGEEALSRIEQGGVDLVLMDCQMPVLDGFAATRRWRTVERERGVLVPRQLPIVALTANATKGDREKCLASGMNDYIAKPFQPDTLFGVLHQYVRQPAGTTMTSTDEWKQAGTG